MIFSAVRPREVRKTAYSLPSEPSGISTSDCMSYRGGIQRSRASAATAGSCIANRPCASKSSGSRDPSTISTRLS